MSCPTSSDRTERSRSKFFTNWARAFDFRSRVAYKPTTRGEIVALILRAEEDPDARIKWTGSRWSFMETFKSEDTIIESDNIAGLVEIDPTNADVGQRRILSRLTLRPAAQRLLANNNLVHLKGGTKIFNANRLLHGLPMLANDVDHLVPASELSPVLNPGVSKGFSTLGGSGGQAIAGAIATGTHGGDFAERPVGDYVAAIHLIGPGGQEWWIERTDGITAGTELATQTELRTVINTVAGASVEFCNDIIVRKDDDLFNAVLVSLGRMGFVYSLVMQVEPAYKLTEVRSESTWQRYNPSLLGRRILEMRGAGGLPLHYLNLLIMPFTNGDGENVCKIAERVKHVQDASAALPANRIGLPSGFDITQVLCRISDARVLVPVLLLATGLLFTIAASILATIPGLAAVPFAGPFLAIAAATAAVAVGAAAISISVLAMGLLFGGRRTLREIIGTVSAIGNSIGQGELVISLLTNLFDSIYPVTENGAPYTRTNFSWKIMDTYPYGPEGFCEKVDSMDFAFQHDLTSTSRPAYYDFIDEVLDVFEDLRSRRIAVAGNIALRYCRATRSHLGMTKYTFTCHAEIAVLRDFPGTTEFVERVQALAKTYNAVPSWGQVFSSYDGREIASRHRNFETWRRALTYLIRTGGGNNFTFSNAFTRRYNLEPWEDLEIATLELRITVGNDHLGDTTWPIREDISQDFVTVGLRDGRTVTIRLNHDGTNWETWLIGTTHTRSISLPAGTERSSLDFLRIRHNAAGPDIGADNWTMNGIVITATTTAGPTEELHRQTGNPIFQFQKNANQDWTYLF